MQLPQISSVLLALSLMASACVAQEAMPSTTSDDVANVSDPEPEPKRFCQCYCWRRTGGDNKIVGIVKFDYDSADPQCKSGDGQVCQVNDTAGRTEDCQPVINDKDEDEDGEMSTSAAAD